MESEINLHELHPCTWKQNVFQSECLVSPSTFQESPYKLRPLKMLTIMTTTLSHLQFHDRLFAMQFLNLGSFYLLCHRSLIFYQHILPLNTDFAVKLEQKYIMMGLAAVERHSWNRVQIVGEGHMFMATTNYTWNSFKHSWPHLSFSSSIVSKINGHKSKPGSGGTLLFLKRMF